MKKTVDKKQKYTCKEYREEMMLVGLTNRLKQENLSEEERKAIHLEIEALKKAMQLD